MKKIFADIVGILVLGSLSAPALAAPASPVSLKGDVKLEKTIVENGVEKQTLTEPKVVVPGDKLLFSTAYRNAGAAPVEHFVVTNPLPSAVTLAPESAASLEVSIDGGKTWGSLAKMTVADGKGGRRGAQATDVTHVRWTLATIAPGASGAVQYHAIVR